MYTKVRLIPMVLVLLGASVTCLSQQQSAMNPLGFYNVKVYGADGNGTSLESKAINKTIEAASQAGGGTVYFPAGNYLTGSIRLKSNISIFIGEGATLIAAPVKGENGYDAEEPGSNNAYQDAGHSHWHNSLMWGDSIHDVSIVGPGTIWGRGLYKDWVDDKQSANKAIALVRCRNVIIRDISIRHGGWFAILATGVDNFTLDNVTMDTNRDGVDVDCCRNVRISNCLVNSPYDDGICLKSSFALGYARATENVTITNCQLSGYNEGTLLDGTFKRTENAEYKNHPTGRIKFGTESNGGFKNVTISNCVFDYCQGFALETVDGGALEDVAITNITMRDMVNDPIFMRLGARMRGPKGNPIGNLRRITISNIVAYNVNPLSACTISGLLGHDIEDINLSNIRIYYKGGIAKDRAGREISENADKYPEPGMFGEAPAYGLFIRHAKDIKLNDVQFSYLSPDYRPAFRCDDVEGLSMRHVTAQSESGSDLIVLNNVSDCNILQSTGLPDQYIAYANKRALKQEPPQNDSRKMSVLTASSFIKRIPNPDSIHWVGQTNHFSWQAGYIMFAMEKLWRATGDSMYFKYIKRYVDQQVDEKGNIPDFMNTSLDNFLPGYAILFMYEQTHQEKYKTAAKKMREGFTNYPRTRDGLFWHGDWAKHQAWVDGVFMGQMFLARYGSVIGESTSAFDEVVRQMTLIADHCQKGNGLLLHGWDESKEAGWADKTTGLAPEVWSEGLGWYAVLIADVFDYLPRNHPGYQRLVSIHQRLCEGLKNAQDPNTGMWCQVVDKCSEPGNWNETSGTGMFLYLLEKSIKKGYIRAAEYTPVVHRAYAGIIKKARLNSQGFIDLLDCSSIGIKDDYKDYVSQPKEISTFAAFGSFILGTSMMEDPKE